MSPFGPRERRVQTSVKAVVMGPTHLAPDLTFRPFGREIARVDSDLAQHERDDVLLGQDNTWLAIGLIVHDLKEGVIEVRAQGKGLVFRLAATTATALSILETVESFCFGNARVGQAPHALVVVLNRGGLDPAVPVSIAVGQTHFGIEPGRVHFSWVSAAEGGRFAQIVEKVTKEVKELGPITKMVKEI